MQSVHRDTCARLAVGGVRGTRKPYSRRPAAEAPERPDRRRDAARPRSASSAVRFCAIVVTGNIGALNRGSSREVTKVERDSGPMGNRAATPPSSRLGWFPEGPGFPNTRAFGCRRVPPRNPIGPDRPRSPARSERFGLSPTSTGAVPPHDPVATDLAASRLSIENRRAVESDRGSHGLFEFRCEQARDE